MSNTANSNRNGIDLDYSNNNTLTNNNCSNNSRDGVHLSSSCNDNMLYHNNLINNTNYNAYDDGTNQWDSGSEGNYYSDYTGTDPDGDGIGNIPHLIHGGSSVDRFPLMHSWKEIPPLKGDLDGDSQITSADAAIALQMSVCSKYCSTADVSGDGRVTSLDALMILQAMAGSIRIG
ncbi:MAG: Periplasmic copper-binding protein (NosD) [Candidatus Argoarchaeum ethanivorans]|uniref:Periplasmic copper-binding protein (NosD) n=1 Tax=Candidatus Argoarchaeum ethanivorans TaxID=2608793 RepID=A0A811TGS2_9EURY|nr:MAG: Periplasmic copper-binding protein (NosD) [Candidatus Argoarchaeum ethanivorans]